MHVALRRLDVGVGKETTGIFDPLLAANLRPALMPRQVRHEIPRQPCQIPQPGVRPTEIRNGPCLPGRGEDRPGLTITNRQADQIAELLADGDAARLPGLARGLMLPQDDRIRRRVDVGNCCRAQFPRSGAALPEGEIDQTEIPSLTVKRR